MELIFIRHGQGEHNLNFPGRLSIPHPKLTEKGKEQVQTLAATLQFDNNDIFIASPTLRTIETANIITGALAKPRKYISPLVGPRVFPLYTDSRTEVCDLPLSAQIIDYQFPEYIRLNKADEQLWKNGINTIEQHAFNTWGESLLQWIRQQNSSKAYIIAHDGTITSYRLLLGEQGLTRAHFLGEAGLYAVNI